MSKQTAALLFLFIVGFFSTTVFAAEEVRPIKTGVISGQIMIKVGEPMSGGFVFFFSETTRIPKSLREPAESLRIPEGVFPLDGDGKFTVEIPEGRYYLGAIKKTRNSQMRMGPPEEGDFFLMGQDAKGNQILYTVTEGKKTDIGLVSGALLVKKDTFAASGSTSIAGLVLDDKGKPVEGVLVLAFLEQSMEGRPLFISDRTGKDGKYQLKVYAGKYYLRARENTSSGPPEKGDLMGVYSATESVAVKAGEALKDITIFVRKFPGRGKYKE